MRFPVLLIAVLYAGTAYSRTPAIKADAAYVLVDVGDLDDALMKGGDMPGTLTIGRYDPLNQDIRGGERSPATALSGKQSPHVFIDRSPVAKIKGVRQYLVEIAPDNWVIEGANGTAFSLGSLSFDVRPGTVVDLGVVKPTTDWAPGEGPKSAGSFFLNMMLKGAAKPKNLRPVRLAIRPRIAQDLPLPTILAGREVVPAAFTRSAKFGNYLGGLVNRIGGRAERLRELRDENAAAEGAGQAPVERGSPPPEAAVGAVQP